LKHYPIYEGEYDRHGCVAVYSGEGSLGDLRKAWVEANKEVADQTLLIHAVVMRSHGFTRLNLEDNVEVEDLERGHCIREGCTVPPGHNGGTVCYHHSGIECTPGKSDVEYHTNRLSEEQQRWKETS